MSSTPRDAKFLKPAVPRPYRGTDNRLPNRRGGGRRLWQTKEVRPLFSSLRSVMRTVWIPVVIGAVVGAFGCNLLYRISSGSAFFAEGDILARVGTSLISSERSFFRSSGPPWFGYRSGAGDLASVCWQDNGRSSGVLVRSSSRKHRRSGVFRGTHGQRPTAVRASGYAGYPRH